MINSNETCLSLSTVIKLHLQHNKTIPKFKKELLSFVKVFKEFQQMLLGPKLIVYTDHKNLIHHNIQLMTQHVLCWC